MAESIIPLLVVVPLFAAPLSLLLPSFNWRWSLAIAASAFSLFCSVALLLTCLDVGVLSYPMGNWPPPIGIEYRIDVLTCYFLCFISLCGFAALLAGRHLIEREIEPERRGVFIAAYLLLISGLCGIVATGDIFNIFVFLEISSLATYTLIAIGRDPRGLVSSLRYLIIGTVGTTFFLVGIGLLYAMTGTLNIADLGTRLAGADIGRVYQTAIACIVLGTAIKAAIVPFHLWLPPCYSYAPSIVTVFLSAAATKTSLYVLYRVGMSVCGWQVFYDELYAVQLLLWVSCFAVVFCSWQAFRQNDIRMILAWSSLGQIAYITLSLGLASEAGRQASLVLMFSHALVKSTLFLALACLCAHLGSSTLAAVRGIGQRNIFVAVIFTAATLGLIGIPTTAGFIAKWYIYLAAIESGLWLVVVAIVAASLIGLAYGFRMIATIWSQDDSPVSSAPAYNGGWLCASVLAAMVLLIFGLGLMPGPWLEIAAQASALNR